MNWKTTTAAVAAAVAAVATAVSYMMDADPSTSANWTAVASTVAAAAGLFFAKDSDK